eukprot:2196196-Amphidinium_carterae.1
MLQTLGWEVSVDEKKCQPFGLSFDVLGVTAKLHKCLAGQLELANKRSRIESLSKEVDEVVATG